VVSAITCLTIIPEAERITAQFPTVIDFYQERNGKSGSSINLEGLLARSTILLVPDPFT
jgi:hypothetical protein